MALNNCKCINMQIKNLEAKGLGDINGIAKVAICREKIINLEKIYQKLFEMGYESSFLSQCCPFYNNINQSKINKCPWYKEKK